MSNAIRALIAFDGGLTATAGAERGMSRRLTAAKSTCANSSEFIIRELRDSEPYLADGGWHQVARLMLAAADEIEQLHARIGELEGSKLRGS